jgi:hypothetical protein
VAPTTGPLWPSCHSQVWHSSDHSPIRVTSDMAAYTRSGGAAMSREISSRFVINQSSLQATDGRRAEGLLVGTPRDESMEGVFDVLRHQSVQLYDGCVASGRHPGEITRSGPVGLQRTVSLARAGELADVAPATLRTRVRGPRYFIGQLLAALLPKKIEPRSLAGSWSHSGFEDSSTCSDDTNG